MINVMYHYVRDDSEEYPYFNHLKFDIFKKQLDYFKKKYGFISKQDYINSIKNKINIKGVVLTFDDGFKDHYDFILPELTKRNLWGIFYIPTAIYKKKQLLGVHRIQYLKGKYGSSKILDKIKYLIKDYMLDETTIEEFDKEIYSYSKYDDNDKQLKRMLNYYIKYEYVDTILDDLMIEFFDENELFNNVYLSCTQIKELKDHGNIIGSHTVNHKVLSRLSYKEQYSEIKNSFDFIDDLVEQEYKSFCYPYGYKSSYNQNTLNILKDLKIDDACIFDNNHQDDIIKQYELSRIDCNQFMGV